MDNLFMTSNLRIQSQCPQLGSLLNFDKINTDALS